MSRYSLQETQQLQMAAKKAAETEAAKERLTQRNKEAAREQLLRMQVLLARMSPK